MNHKKTTLSNGLRVITVPMKNTQTVTVLLMVSVGSRYESKKQAGISHFLEHMFFKGTAKRPSTLSITEELDAIGGEYNAFTGKDQTICYAKVDAKHFTTALDIVSDIYLHSKLDKKEIEREKGTIIQEINLYEDTPVRNVHDIFEKLLYDGNSLGQELAGNKKTVSSFQKKDLENYRECFYVANDTLMAIAGNFNEKKALAEAKKYFSEMKKGEKPSCEKISDKQKNPQVKIKYKKTDQTHLVLGVRAYDYNHKDRFALALLSVILGGNMSSRLFIEVREKRGMAYHISTGAESYADCGYLATAAGVEHKNLEIVVRTILGEYKKIASEKVSEKELQKAKDFLKGRAVMNFESSDEVAAFFIDQEMKRKKMMTLEQVFQEIGKVKTEDILRVAKDIFRPKNLNLAVIGPHKNEEKLRKLL